MIRYLLLSLALLSPLASATDFLPPSMAFRPTAEAIDGQTIEVRFAIADGYYLYRDKFRFAAKAAGQTLRLGKPVLPQGKRKVDETFGEVEVYFNEALIRLPIIRSDTESLPISLEVTSQGCAEEGICYPPHQQPLSLVLPALDTTSSPATTAEITGNESGRIAQLLRHASFWLIIASFFGFGLLLSLTPCILPMIPILSGIIVSAGRDGHGVSHARGFFLSLAYVLGMATSYAAAGAAAGLTGTLLSTALQNPWVLGSFALLFVVLAFSMFGFYELQLPGFLQSKVSEEAAHFKGGSFPGLVLMGALSALIVGPCVAAPLAGALLYIGQTGNALLGGLALFCMALGMGVPLLAVGLSAGTLLPRSGPWMVLVKRAFGLILLGTALWLVSPFLPQTAQWIAWALLLILPAGFMITFRSPQEHTPGWTRWRKRVGIALLVGGAVLMVSAFLSRTEHPLPFERVRSLAELNKRLKASDKPVMLDFYADWCVTCKQMERQTFSDARVRQAVSGMLLLQADVTNNTENDKELLARFNLFGPPGILFFDRQGTEIAKIRVVGLQTADEFLDTLNALH